MKMGIGIVISSTDEFYTFFQSICESNMRKEKQDGIIRHFQGNLKRMVKERPEYALVVHRAKEQLGENSIAFRTQYGCEFIGMKRETFFNIKNLNDLGIFRLQYDDRRFLDNPRFVIVSGWDYSPISDNSTVTIKAIAEGFGQIRKTYLIKQEILNQERSSQINSVSNQIDLFLHLCKIYNIQAVCLDSTGVGANLRELIIEKLVDRDDINLDINMITEIKFNQYNRVDMLDNYMNRLNSGLEILFTIEKDFMQLDILKKYYNNVINVFDEESDKIRFLYEHSKFIRSTTIGNDGKMKIIFKQAEEYKLKDDTIFSSVLATHNLTLFPMLSYSETNTGLLNYNETDSTNYYRI
jgi:hypothetical protein